MLRTCISKIALSAAGATAMLAVSHDAAALTRETQIIVLDASGSMLDPAKPNPGNPDVNLSKWDEAFSVIERKLNAQKRNVDAKYDGTLFSARNHCIAVWAFAGSWLRQVYPTPAGVPFDITDPTTVNDSQFRCTTDLDHVTDPNDTTTSTLYDEIASDLKFTIMNNAAVKPQSGAPSTPLAKSVCMALKATRNIQQGAGGTRRVMLLSDGLENSTPSSNECGETTPAGTTKLSYTYDKKDAAGTNFLWAGGVLTTQWEYKVFNVAIFNSVTPGPFKAGFTVADLNKRPINETFDAFLARIFPGSAPANTQKVMVDVFALYDYVAPQASIPSKLQNMFDDLAVKTKGATQRILYGTGYPIPAVGTKLSNGQWFHQECANRIPGDVDCNNVVDDADYNQLTQATTWRLPVLFGYDRTANPPIVRFHEQRNRCDFNRDGVVNGFDEDILLNHYGESK